MAQLDYSYFNLNSNNKLPLTWPKNLLIFTIVVFILFIGGLVGVKYFTDIKLKELNTLEQSFTDIRSSFPVEDETEISLFEKKLSNLEQLLNNHIYFSHIISFLEKNTHPDIYYTNMSFSSADNSVELRGIAKNQKVLSEAVNNFFNLPQDINTIILEDVKTQSDLSVQFSLKILFKPQILH